MSLKFTPHLVAAGLAVGFAGCQEATTRSDVADAREEVRDEQQDVAEAKREAGEEIADAEHDADQARHEAMKPVLEGDAAEEAAEANQNVAEAKADANAEIRDEQKDVDAAAAELKKTEAEHQATLARDGFAKQANQQIELADERIAQLEERHDNAEGAEAETLQKQIDALKSQRDRVKDAVDGLQGEELMKWQDHQRTVQQEVSTLQQLLQTNQ